MAREGRSRKAGDNPRLAAVRAQPSGLCSAGKETACGNRLAFGAPRQRACLGVPCRTYYVGRVLQRRKRRDTSLCIHMVVRTTPYADQKALLAPIPLRLPPYPPPNRGCSLRSMRRPPRSPFSYLAICSFSLATSACESASCFRKGSDAL